MLIFLMSLVLYAQRPLPGNELKSPPIAPAVANTALVSDYRIFGEMKRTYTETPVAAEVERWRQGFMEKTPAQQKASYADLPGFTAMKLRGLEDNANLPSLRLEFKTMLALDAPILAFSHQPQFRERIELLINRLAELPEEDGSISLPDLGSEWSEEIWLPQDFVLVSPLVDADKAFGLVQLHRTLKRQPGRLTLKMRCTLTQTSATPAERAATIAALKEIPTDAPLQCEARVLSALATEAVVPAMNELREQATDPELRTWATIQRAAAFGELFLPKLGTALLDAALVKTPKEASLLRARIMLGLAMRPSLFQARQQLIPYLERLLEKPPSDAARLQLELAKLLSDPNFSEPLPSVVELKQAATLYRGLSPDHWGHDYALLLMKLGDYEAMQQALAHPKAKLGAADQRMLTLTALAGRHQTEELAKVLAKLEPEHAKSAINQAYGLLVASAQVEPLRVLAEHGRELFSPKQLTEIEGAVGEARILPSNQSPEGIYRGWLRAISQRDRGAMEKLILPESLALDRSLIESTFEAAIGEGGLKWPFGVAEFSLQGDPNTGYLLDIKHARYFFASNQDGFRLVTFDKELHLAGQYILRLIERGQLEGAYQWLDWFYKEEGFRLRWLASGADFWSDALPRTEETALLAAKLMAFTGPGAESVGEDLRAAFESASGQRRDDLAILFILTGKASDDFLSEADFTPSQPDSTQAMVLSFWMCVYHGKCQSLEETCASNEEDDSCLWMITGLQGGYAALLANIQDQEKEGSVETKYKEMLLHFALQEPEVPEIPVAYLPEESPTEMMVYYAEQGMIEDVLLALSQRPDRPNRSLESYLLGRMAEIFGEPQLARAFYAELKPPPLMMLLLDTNYRLAKKHLDRLGGP